ncbi:MAG: RNA polymerase sigma factor [Opitutales bacterium]
MLPGKQAAYSSPARPQKGAATVALDANPLIEAAVNEVLSGNLEAFRVVVEHTQISVRAVVLSLLPEADDADEIAQDVYVKLFEHLHEYQPGTRFLAWAKAFARNVALTERNRRRRARRRLTALADDPEDTPDWEAALATDEGQDSEMIARLVEAVQGLPSGLREVVETFYFQQFSVEETAEKLGLRSGAVKVKLHRARKRLAARLELR